MFNYQVTQYLAAQHRDDLLREAAHDRLAREVTAGTRYTSHRLLNDIRHRMATLFRGRLSGHVAVPAPSETPA